MSRQYGCSGRTFLLVAVAALWLALPACSLLPSPYAPIVDLAGAISSTETDLGGLSAEIEASHSLSEVRKTNLNRTIDKAKVELDEAKVLLSHAGDGPLPVAKIETLIRSARERANSIRALLQTP